ncbi:hypothetical protein TNCV_2376091 [Trichonephila clavipes]|nr:hypothetical protein TNCV_2376091 [Trichonephila clavipes]
MSAATPPLHRMNDSISKLQRITCAATAALVPVTNNQVTKNNALSRSTSVTQSPALSMIDKLRFHRTRRPQPAVGDGKQ